jgi:hypothetical protein
VPTKLALINVKEKYVMVRIDLLAPVGPETEAAVDHAVLSRTKASPLRSI